MTKEYIYFSHGLYNYIDSYCIKKDSIVYIRTYEGKNVKIFIKDSQPLVFEFETPKRMREFLDDFYSQLNSDDEEEYQEELERMKKLLNSLQQGL